MGNDLSTSIIPPPFTLRDCFVDGELNLYRYRAYRQRKERYRLHNLRVRSLRSKMSTHSNSNHHKRVRKRNTRSTKKHRLFVRDDNGELREYTMKDTLWYRLYCYEDVLDKRLEKKFRNRFRIPHNYYKELLNDITNNELFKRYTKNDCTGSPPCLVSLLLLGMSILSESLHF